MLCANIKNQFSPPNSNVYKRKNEIAKLEPRGKLNKKSKKKSQHGSFTVSLFTSLLKTMAGHASLTLNEI